MKVAGEHEDPQDNLLESRMMRKYPVRFGRLRHEAVSIAVEPGNRTQPDALPSVLYRDMQQE